MDDFQQGLIDAVNRLAAAVEGVSLGPKKKARANKPGSESTRGVIDEYQGPNNWGFFDVKIDGVKYSTRSSSLGGELGKAFKGDSVVEITFETKETTKGGKSYTNRYIQTVEVVEDNSAAASAEETPF